MAVRACILKAVSPELLSVNLKDKIPTVLGRGPFTKIREKRCSREQVEVTADFGQEVVNVKQIGGNSSSVHGKILKQGEITSAKNGAIIEMIHGQFQFIVEFEKTTEIEVQQSSTPFKKARLDDYFLPSATKTNLAMNTLWECVDGGSLYICNVGNSASSPKIAGFDLDGTLITTKSGKTFPTNTDDWKLLSSKIPAKLEQLLNDGWRIVIFTNQAGLANGKLKIEDLKQKLSDIGTALGVPHVVYVSSGKGLYRKPCTGMWKLLCEKANDDIDMEKSFYCGDAAGRVVNWAPGRKKDFSCSDRLFAINIGLTFYTPEEYFLQNKPGKYKLPDFIPSNFASSANFSEDYIHNLIGNQHEVIVMVGSPGAGKSHFVQKYLLPRNYSHVTRDILGTQQKCVGKLKDELKKKISVVIDNTNPDPVSRKVFIDAAKMFDVPVRCFLLDLSFDHIKHNIKFREMIDSNHAKINDMVLHVYKKKFVAPSTSEGFSEIIKVPFIPSVVQSSHSDLYFQYLL